MSNFKNFNKSTVSLDRNSMKCTAKLKVINDLFNHKFELIFFFIIYFSLSLFRSLNFKFILYSKFFRPHLKEENGRRER